MKKSGKVFETLTALAVLFFSVFFFKNYQDTRLIQLTDEKWEKHLILNYVKNHPKVQAIGGEKFKVLTPYCLMQDYLPTRCEISVKGAKKFYAIVDIFRSSGNPTLILACIIYTPSGQDDSLMDICNQ